MRIFIDTEFTDFKVTQLISIGMIAEDGQQFYAELNDFDLSGCSAFVKQVVLPKLYKNPSRVMSIDSLRTKMSQWLSQFADGDPVISYDFDGDWKLFCHVMRDEMPTWLKSEDVFWQIDDLLVEQFFMESGRTDHHALHDAMANRFAYKENRRVVGIVI